jgi:hypothetical protein
MCVPTVFGLMQSSFAILRDRAATWVRDSRRVAPPDLGHLLSGQLGWGFFSSRCPSGPSTLRVLHVVEPRAQRIGGPGCSTAGFATVENVQALVDGTDQEFVPRDAPGRACRRWRCALALLRGSIRSRPSSPRSCPPSPTNAPLARSPRLLREIDGVVRVAEVEDRVSRLQRLHEPLVLATKS